MYTVITMLTSVILHTIITMLTLLFLYTSYSITNICNQVNINITAQVLRVCTSTNIYIHMLTVLQYSPLFIHVHSVKDTNASIPIRSYNNTDVSIPTHSKALVPSTPTRTVTNCSYFK